MAQDDQLVPGHKVELGAEFVHGSTTRINAMGDEFGWQLNEVFTWAHGDGGPSEHPTEDGGWGAYWMGREKKLLAFDSKDEDFTHLNEALWAIAAIPAAESERDPRSVQTYLKDAGVSPRMLALAEAGYANTCGGPMHDISLRFQCANERVWDQNDGDGDFRIEGSFSQLVDALSDPTSHDPFPYRNPAKRVVGRVEEPLRVRTCTPVAQVHWTPPTCQAAAGSGGGGEAPALQLSGVPCASSDLSCASASPVRVVTRGGEILGCDVCVFTAPLPLLRDGAIQFYPPLPPAKKGAAARIGIGQAAKLLLVFSERVWPAKLHGVVCADAPIPELWFRELKGAGSGGQSSLWLATGYLMGNFAQAARQRGQAESLAVACAQLEEMFGGGELGQGHERVAGKVPKATQHLVKGVLHDWAAEPYARVGYTHGRAGTDASADFATLGAPLAGGRVFFAGEAYLSVGANMSVHAALEQGHHAAWQVAAQLNATAQRPHAETAAALEQHRSVHGSSVQVNATVPATAAVAAVGRSRL
jgi:lysine-specific histone demethylase 1B